MDGEMVKTNTTSMHIGKALNMTCRDRDWFVMDIPKNQLEAIWTLSAEEYTYDTISVEFGQIKVKNSTSVFDNYFNEFIENGEFACYNGKIYKSISGVNHKKYFLLVSYDKDSQAEGFIMEEPNKFYNQVNPSHIEFAFQSRTWCMYEEKEFVVVESSNDNRLRIQPWSRETYPESELKNLGFENLLKWIEPKDTSSIWTVTEKIHDFDRFENKNKRIK